MFAAPAPTGTQNPLLIFSIATLDANHSAVRADAQVLWLDDAPYRDDAGGRRVRLTTAGECPTSVHGVVGVRSLGPGLSEAWLPAGAPTGALICRYTGPNGTPQSGRLVGHRTIGAADAARLAAVVRRVPLSHVDGGVVNAPGNPGRTTVIALAFTGHWPDVDLWYRAGELANGQIRGRGSGALGQTLASLATPPRQ